MNSFNATPFLEKKEESRGSQLLADHSPVMDAANEEIQACLERGDIGAAMPLIQKAIHEGKTDEVLLNNLGYACWESGHREKALECFYNAAILNPVDMDSLANFVDASYELRQYGLLEKYLQAMADATPAAHEYLYLLADCLLKQGRHGEAGDALEQLLSKEPDYPGAQELMAGVEKNRVG